MLAHMNEIGSVLYDKIVIRKKPLAVSLLNIFLLEGASYGLFSLVPKTLLLHLNFNRLIT